MLSTFLNKICSYWYFLAFGGVFWGMMYVSGFSIPAYCLFKKVSGIPCSGCGLMRAYVHLLNFRFTEAAKQNILVTPFALSALAGSVCFLADRFFGKNWLSCLHSALTSQNAVRASIVLAIFSWVYNIIMGN